MRRVVVGLSLSSLLGACAQSAAGPATAAPATPPAAAAGPAAAPPAFPSADASADQTVGWTATDEAILVQGFSADCFAAAPWVEAFFAARGRQPVVRVSSVVNKTTAPIITEILAGALERLMLASGAVKVAAGLRDLHAIQAEQDGAAVGLAEDGLPIGEELPADFVGTVTLHELVEPVPGGTAQAFVAGLRLVDAETGEIVCASRAESKRLVTTE